MRILISPTALKGTLGPVGAAAAIGRGARRALPNAELIELPIADGGDGTGEVLLNALGGDWVEATAMGPLGKPLTARYAWLGDDTAMVEVAAASGLALAPESGLDPMLATTRGTGDLIASAIERRPSRVIVGAGGSAASDGGVGILEALGVLFLDDQGASVTSGAEGLLSLARLDVSNLNLGLRNTPMSVACDVDNPLVGQMGSAAVFAPQKGASPSQIGQIEVALGRLADVIAEETGVRIHDVHGAGAGGGVAGGLHGVLGADLRDGFELIAEMIGFGPALEGADLLIVGEGKLDESSLGGKAPGAAATRAAAANVPVWAFAGKVTLEEEQLEQFGIEMWADLQALAGAEAQTRPAKVLEEAAFRMLGRAFGPK